MTQIIPAKQTKSQSLDLKPTELPFQLLETKLKTEIPSIKQQLKASAVQAGLGIPREEIFVVGFRPTLNPSIKNNTLKEPIRIVLICPITFEPVKMEGL